MKKIEVEIEGVAPLLQNKIPDDMDVTQRKGEGKDTAEGCKDKVYKLGSKICQPATHLEQAMIKTATGIKLKGQGKKTYKDMFKGTVFVKPEYIPHKIQKWVVNKTTVVIPSTKGRITRFRPMFEKWALAFEIEVLDDRVSSEVVKMALDEAGRTNGLGDNRPRFGRFIVTKFKEK